MIDSIKVAARRKELSQYVKELVALRNKYGLPQKIDKLCFCVKLIVPSGRVCDVGMIQEQKTFDTPIEVLDYFEKKRADNNGWCNFEVWDSDDHYWNEQALSDDVLRSDHRISSIWDVK